MEIKTQHMNAHFCKQEIFLSQTHSLLFLYYFLSGTGPRSSLSIIRLIPNHRPNANKPTTTKLQIFTLAKKNKNEMKILLNEIEQIENALELNAKATKLAETRLENRCQRPGMELCMDGVYSGLCDEIKQLQFAQHQLIEKLSTSKASYNKLELSLQHIEIDLKKKQHTLATDIRALDVRQRLRCDASEDHTTENRQLPLTNLHQET